MKRNSQLSDALHVLLHMASRAEPMTSDEVAACLNTNPVVVRRTMAGLREAGLVASARGHGGGWTLKRDPASVSLREVYAALGEPLLFQIGPRTESPGCLVEQAVNRVIGSALDEARTILVAALNRTNLADLAADVQERLAARKQEIRHAV